jgi:methyl coenzyme M reductase subunit C-like uncharacterized protein (methanogenesis marker protein 7)
MNFLIDLFKKAIKGDNFRVKATPDKYSDKISQLNTQSPNQASKLTTSKINQIQKTNSVLTQSTSKGSILPGK